MDRIGAALAAGRDVLFEGACGTGKTLAALAPALAYARHADKTVAITTSVNQQARQFVREARELRTTADPPIRAAVFRGKASMCHLDVGYRECQVLRENTREAADLEREREQLGRRADALADEALASGAVDAAEAAGGEAPTDGPVGTPDDAADEAARARSEVVDDLGKVEERLADLEDANTCSYYRGTLDADEAAFAGWLHDGVRTPEAVYEYAHERGQCGYELLKAAMADVDLVVCNYNHLLDPTIRPAFFRWLDRDPDDVVAVFDEAHNVAASAREHGTRTLTEATLDAALEELADHGGERAAAARAVLEPFRDAVASVARDAVGGGPSEGVVAGDVGEDWADVPVADGDGPDDLTRAFLRGYAGDGLDADLEAARSLGGALDEEYEAAYRRGETEVREECPTLTATRFVEAFVGHGDEPARHPVAGVRRAGDRLRGRAELYTTLPEPVTAELFDALDASVLMSATLRPFGVAADSLGLTDPAELAYGLTFPPENRRTLAVDTPPLFASEREDPAVQRAVADALADAVRFSPGNALCFFPSYGEAARYHERLSSGAGGPGQDGTAAGDAPCLLDEPGVDAADLRERFVDADGAALFTSLWGTLTEGVSFDGDDATTAVVVGVPYPRVDARSEAVQDAYAAAFGDRSDHPDPGWAYGVEVPTVRKTRQALGRVLRGPEEVAARVLLDRRYCAGAREDLGRYSVHDTFPPEEHAELVDVDADRLRYALLNFFGEHGAYGGDPPAPE
ncbi:MAG: ATP-dependent DNA helicase [Halobacteriaceae archaeon]